MPYTIADVGDIPGKPPLTDEQKQAFVDEWNANEVAVAARELAETAAQQKAADRKLLADFLPDIISLIPGLDTKLPAAAKAAYDRLRA